MLLGQGNTAEVLRNLCLSVATSSEDDWTHVVELMKRLFNIALGKPVETSRGIITLAYRQTNVKEALDISSAGRGMLQMLLVFAYLYSHKGSVLLVDEPDAHLEILRQKQVYVLLRDIASKNGSQVVIVTHSEQILDEAVDRNLTLLLEGKADDIAGKQDIRNSLKHFGADHYVRARERGYVLYVEGGTDVDMLRALAERLNHSAAEIWDERVNTFYVRNNHPSQDTDAELERVEGGYGNKWQDHFNGLRGLLPKLLGLAILDNDGQNRQSRVEGNLDIRYWRRYETENYFVTPDLLRNFARSQYPTDDLFTQQAQIAIDDALADVVSRLVFDGVTDDYAEWQRSTPAAARLVWEAKTERRKLSAIAEEFFRVLASKLKSPMLLKKGEFHRLVSDADLSTGAEAEVREKLDELAKLFDSAQKHSEESAS